MGQSGRYKLTFEHRVFKNLSPCRGDLFIADGYCGADPYSKEAANECLRDLSRPPEERDDRQDQKNNETDFRDPRGGSSNPAKAEKSSNEGDNEKNNGVVKHMGWL